jgi:small conductance mechanosensitive channel
VIGRIARLAAVAALLVLAALLLGSGSPGSGATPPAPAALAPPEAAPPEPAVDSAAGRRERAREELRQELRSAPRNLAEVGEALGTRMLEHLPGIVTGLVLLLVFVGLGRLAARLLRRVMTRGGADPALANVTIPLVRFAFYGLAVVAAMEQMGFNVGSLLAGVGVAGLAIGLAAQETLGNIFAGFVLLWDRPFRLGDAVTISGTFGHVTEIGLRSTRLRTLEHREVTIPNRQVIQEQIVNHTRYPKVRLNVPFGVAHGADLDRVRAVLLESAAANPGVAREPAPQMVVVALTDSAVQVELRVWIEDPSAERANFFHVLEIAKRALDAAGVEIPFPQRVVHMVGAAPAEAVR